jgi:protein-S-isoprenylcysteine O-methyltransferase Ste14
MTVYHLCLWIAVVATAYVLWLLRKDEAPPKPDADPWVRHGQLPVRVIGMVMLLWTPEWAQWDSHWILRSIAGLIAAYGCLMMVVCIDTLGRSASRGQWVVGPLVTTGLYGGSRNPFYIWVSLTALNASTFMANGVAYFFAVLLTILLYRRILQEEKDLEAAYGQEYLDYKKRTPRFLRLW